MGVSASKRVGQRLSESPEFNPACDSVFNDSLSLAQFAFPGIKPYQLLSATQKLHSLLANSNSTISKWVPTPPDRSQVDRAYQRVNPGGSEFLDMEQFRVFAVRVFSDAVVSGASAEFLKLLPIGVVGIGGVGVLAGANGRLLGAAIASYALSLATAAYFTLGG